MATLPDPANATTLDSSTTSATLELFKAVLGPVNTDYYLKAFTRFDANDRAGLSWNWAAGLLTLNWMALRQLWGAALAYVGTVLASALLIFGIGRLVFGLSFEAQMAWLVGMLSLAVAIPGVFGNAWLYNASRKKMEKALAANATLADACAMLRRQAATRQRVIGLAIGNGMLLAGLTGLVFSFQRLQGSIPAQRALAAKAPEPIDLAIRAATAPSAPPAVAASAIAVASSSPAASPVAASPVAVASAANVAASSPSATVSAPASASAPVLAPAPALASASAPASNVSAVAVPAASAAAAPTKAASALQPLATASRTVPVSTAPTTPTVRAPRRVVAGSLPTLPAASASASANTRTKAEAEKAPVREVKAEGTAVYRYLINVGLFADENNARNAAVKLEDADIPLLLNEIETAKGKRTKVRAGPFATQAEAQRAADKIQLLGLEAVIVRRQVAGV